MPRVIITESVAQGLGLCRLFLAEKVESYKDGLNQTDFVTSRLTYDATLRNLELIGEAATTLSISRMKADIFTVVGLSCTGLRANVSLE